MRTSVACIGSLTSSGIMEKRLRYAPVATLKQRREFLRVRGGCRWSCVAFVIETRKRAAVDRASSEVFQTEPATPDDAPRIGYTVTKRIGNAVVRNRIKRRFRAAAAQLCDGELRNGHDYVLIARSGALKRSFNDLTQDMRDGLKHIHRTNRNSRTRKRR